MNKLIAIDGNSLMHRAYWALPGMSAKNGAPTGAIYGFISMLLKLLPYQPAYMAVAFDTHTPTFRHEQYTEYKAGRKPTPDDLRAQFPLIKRLLVDMGIAVIECDRYEADDIIGTLARRASERGMDALLVTGDRDALQLIDPHIHVLMTKKGITDTVEYDEAELMKQYGVTPSHMVDLKGLMGDGSDNLPGIPGVGEKTALKLLEKYGSMENVLANAQNESGALRQKLEQNGDSARMSYKLGIIDTDAPITETLDDCVFCPASMAGGVPIMRELELRSLIGRLPAGDVPAVSAEHAAPKCARIEDEQALLRLVKQLKSAQSIALCFGDTLLLATGPAEQYEVVLGATLLDSGLSEQQVIGTLADIFSDGSINKLVFDAKQVMHLLTRYDAGLNGVKYDAMICDYLLHATHPASSLKTLCEERLRLPAGASQLYMLMEKELIELDAKGMGGLYRDMELPIMRVLFDMERIGFAVDTQMLEQLRTDFDARIAKTEKRIYELAGEQFNILSTKQLGAVLFDKLGLPPQKKTKSGYSTDAEVLDTLLDKHEIVPLIQEYRFLSKLKSTFLDGLIAMTKNGRVHTRFNQNVTATGRISSAEPNLQNIPVRTEMGREIRRAFIASPGNLLVGADYSQIELRLLAHMSGDSRMIAAFNSGDDIHARTASEVFGVPLGSVTGTQRSAAKAVNFGIVYGISDFGLARNLGISRKQAGEYIDSYFARYTGVRDYMKSCVENGKKKGYAETLMGRRRELPELNSGNYNTRSFGERAAMNMPIQGTAADIIKLAMVRVSDRLSAESLDARLVLQIHDELIIDTPEKEVERVKMLLRDCMENVMQLDVPLTAEVSAGHSWYDTK